MKKGVRAHQNIELLKWCLQSGVHVVWHILHGLPNEDDDWYRKMAEMIPQILHLPPPRSLTPVDFCRFSEYFMKPEEWGLSLSPDCRYRHIYPVEEEVLHQLAYHSSATTPIENGSATGREGVKSLRRAILKWRQRWAQERRPVLTLIAENERSTRVVEGRGEQSPQEYSLSSLEHGILTACGTGIGRKRLEDRLIERGRTHQEIDGALRRLLDRDLCLEIDGKILSLTRPPSRG